MKNRNLNLISDIEDSHINPAPSDSTSTETSQHTSGPIRSTFSKRKKQQALKSKRIQPNKENSIEVVIHQTPQALKDVRELRLNKQFSTLFKQADDHPPRKMEKENTEKKTFTNFQ